jgi:hypothetical protein
MDEFLLRDEDENEDEPGEPDAEPDGWGSGLEDKDPL